LSGDEGGGTSTIDGSSTDAAADGSAGGSASVSGTAKGQVFAAEGASSVVGTRMTSTGTVGEVEILVVAHFTGGICARLMRPQDVANAYSQLIVLVVSSTTQGSQVMPGVYPVTLGGPTQAAYGANDANCNSTSPESATSGTITLSVVDATSTDGTFDLTFPTGDHLTGSFSAPVCSVSLSNVSRPGPPTTCLP
jgi:hypothetical protein